MCVCEKNHNFARALESLQISVRLITQERDPRMGAMIMTQIGQIQLERNEIDAAISSLQQALTIDQMLWVPEAWASTQLLLAGMHIGFEADENTLVHTPPEPWSHDGI